MAFTTCQISRGMYYGLKKLDYSAFLSENDAPYLPPPLARHASPSKCLSCGSHEWRQHNNVRICAYCRSGQ